MPRGKPAPVKPLQERYESYLRSYRVWNFAGEHDVADAVDGMLKHDDLRERHAEWQKEIKRQRVQGEADKELLTKSNNLVRLLNAIKDFHGL